MAITVVSISTPYTSTSTPSVTVNTPSGVQAGHLLIAHIVWESNSDLISSVPSGWTQIFNATAGTRVIRHALYYKIAASNEPSSYTWGLSSAVEAIGFIIAFSGVDTASPIGNYSNSTSTSSSASCTAPAINIQAAGNWAIHCAANAYGTTYTPPSGYVEEYDTRTGTGSSNISATLSTKEYTAAGSTGDITATAANADYFVAALVELKAFISNRNGSFTISSTTSTSDSGSSGRLFGFTISQASAISVAGSRSVEEYSGAFVISTITSLNTLGVKKNFGQIAIASTGSFSNSGKKSSSGSFVAINLTSSISNVGKRGSIGSFSVGSGVSFAKSGYKQGKDLFELSLTDLITFAGTAQEEGYIFYGSFTITETEEVIFSGRKAVSDIINIVENIALSLFGKGGELINLRKRSHISTTIIGKSRIQTIIES